MAQHVSNFGVDHIESSKRSVSYEQLAISNWQQMPGFLRAYLQVDSAAGAEPTTCSGGPGTSGITLESRTRGQLGRGTCIVKTAWSTQQQSSTRTFHVTAARPDELHIDCLHTQQHHVSSSDVGLDNPPSVLKIIHDEQPSFCGQKHRFKTRPTRLRLLDDLKPIDGLKTAEDFATVFFHILQVHRQLHDLCSLLHRDISRWNIMFRRREGRLYGVLNDWDLSSDVDDIGTTDHRHTSLYRVGTRPYMAHQLHSSYSDAPPHVYHHDLESLLYVMVLSVCPRATAEHGSLCGRWETSCSDETIEASKQAFIWRSILPVYPRFRPAFEWWLFDISRILASALCQIGDAARERRKKRRRAGLSRIAVVRPDAATLLQDQADDRARWADTVTYKSFFEIMSKYDTPGEEYNEVTQEAFYEPPSVISTST